MPPIDMKPHPLRDQLVVLTPENLGSLNSVKVGTRFVWQFFDREVRKEVIHRFGENVNLITVHLEGATVVHNGKSCCPLGLALVLAGIDPPKNSRKLVTPSPGALSRILYRNDLIPGVNDRNSYRVEQSAYEFITHYTLALQSGLSIGPLIERTEEFPNG